MIFRENMEDVCGHRVQGELLRLKADRLLNNDMLKGGKKKSAKIRVWASSPSRLRDKRLVRYNQICGQNVAKAAQATFRSSPRRVSRGGYEVAG